MTSPVEKAKVTCASCGHHYEDWFRASINAELDPDLASDADYLREASTTTCPSCGEVTDVGVVIFGWSDDPA